jgi:hypothetical protein
MIKGFAGSKEEERLSDPCLSFSSVVDAHIDRYPVWSRGFVAKWEDGRQVDGDGS